MLVSRGLGVLLLGLSATASVLDRQSLPTRAAHQIQIPRGQARARADRAYPSRSEQGSGWPRDESEGKRLQSRDVLCTQANGADYTCRDGFTCCLSATGEPDCCPVAVIEPVNECAGGNCTQPLSIPIPAGASIVFVTRTSTSTVTLFTGSPTTSIVRATKTIVITLLDPTEQTETATVTATSFVLKAKRSVNGLPDTTHVTRRAGRFNDPALLQELRKRQGQTVTSTVTSQVLTTVLRQSVVVGTLTDTVFSTKFAAPNAVTTVFVTTTVFVPAGEIPTTEAPPVVPTTPGVVPVVPVPTTTAVIPPPSSATTSLPPSTLRTSTSALSTPLSSSTTAEPSTSMTRMTMMTMITTPLVPTTSTGGPVPTLQPTPSNMPRYTTTQIIGIAVGSLAGLILLVLLAFGLRRIIRNRRSAQAQMRQQLPSPVPGGGGAAFAAAVAPRLGGPSGGRGGAGGAALATNGSTNSNNSAASAPSNHSMLTGEGEVRIVIRPAPKRRTQSSQLWPMPPGHRGRTYSLFVEETTTGETTPQDPGEWSIASERGSVGDGNTGRGGNNNNINTTTIYSTNDPAAERASGSGGRPSTSIFSAGWDRETSFGARSDYSYPGLGTLLTPPPAWHGHAAERGWPRPLLDPEEEDDQQQQPERPARPARNSGGLSGWYPSGSLGIGKAV